MTQTQLIPRAGTEERKKAELKADTFLGSKGPTMSRMNGGLCSRKNSRHTELTAFRNYYRLIDKNGILWPAPSLERDIYLRLFHIRPNMSSQTSKKKTKNCASWKLKMSKPVKAGSKLALSCVCTKSPGRISKAIRESQDEEDTAMVPPSPYLPQNL